MSGRVKMVHANDLKLAEVGDWRTSRPQGREIGRRWVTFAELKGIDAESKLEYEGEGILSRELTFRGLLEIKEPLKNHAEDRLELRTDCLVSSDSIATEWKEDDEIPLSQLQTRLREREIG